MHRFTHALALLLEGGNAARTDLEYEPIADAIEVTLQGYPDEQKADLYARLAESVRPAMGFGALVVAIDKALTDNERTFING